MNLDSKIEAILFVKGEPVKIKQLARLLEVSVEEIKEAVKILEKKLSDRGLQLIFKEDEILLGTRSVLGPLLEKIQKEELNKELSKAALETLAIILYQNPQGVTRSEIDYIRGVNSSFILRNLAIRGLVEKVPHPFDKRTFVYKASSDLLAYLGVSKIEDLPDYALVQEKLASRAAGQNEELKSN